VTTATRSPALPHIPTVSDFVPGCEASFWTGVGAPKNTPAEIVNKLNKEINAALADPKMKARLARRCRARPLILESSSPMKPKSLPRW
jgi:tripartite-type tricarboxylate transporter receptor subunit TctC